MRRASRFQPPVRAPRGWALAGALCGLVATTLIWAPAHWLARGLERATQGQLVLQQPRGTLWNGSALLVLTGGADSHDRAALPTRLEWTLRPRLDGANLQLRSECCTSTPIQLDVQPRWQGLTVSVHNSDTQLPAALLAGLGTPWNTVALQGQLRLATQGLQLQWQAGRWRSQGLTRLEALGVSSRLSPLRPLGSYRLDIEGGDSPQLQLSTLTGDLQLSGQGQWVGQRLHFRGEASASPERETALSNLLNILGRRQGPRSLISFG
ncbi:MAG: type II secretion system protein N [Burkholderiaceae bacterium]|jgi:general secretion pathway protein N|nr:type II secretion system protein N [Burkholderiaceae bacterium]